MTSGGGDEEPIAEYMNRFLITTGVRPVGSVWATMGTIVGDTFPDEIHKQAVALGKKLVASWEKKATSPRVERQMSAFKDRMRSLMIYRQKDWPYEYAYWKKYRGLK